MKLRTLVVLSTFSLGLFIGTTLISSRLSTPIPEQATAGKKVWQRYNCVSCHTLFGNGGYVGEDLTHITAKMERSKLVEYFVNPPVMRPNKYKRHPNLSKSEANSLIEYLKFVDTIPTLGWPPQPNKAGSIL